MVNTSLINLDEINEPIQNVKPEVKSIIEQVLTLEKERLYNNNLRHINDDVLKIIKQNIQ
ncbi:hypothetical protein AA637_03935 [Cyanobacterium sp. HL-69]|uniref:hypothetical protein n=1 Tax=Cyanobacterium sp. HL-69 TaxID=2054282 RepID=UPI000CA36FD9|nr:hypothetical protein AA637_03935 [Cyanobacterium sp. HL-69]